MAHADDDSRHYTRIPFHAVSRLICGAHPKPWPVELLDLSLRGALVSRPNGWDKCESEPCRLEIELGEVAGGPLIAMEGEVAHVEGGRIGLRCLHIDIDSISHLRRLLALNTGDEALLEREVAQMFGG